MSNLTKHAVAEFRAAGWTDADGKFKDDMQQMMCDQVVSLLELFSLHGHSGSSAPYAIRLFSTLAKFEPIVPLTGEDWEWEDVGDGVLQNRRCSHVFKQPDRFDGQAYDIEGVVFFDWRERDLEPDEKGYPGTSRYKSCYTCRDSAVAITFPYTPATAYRETP